MDLNAVVHLVFTPVHYLLKIHHNQKCTAQKSRSRGSSVSQHSTITLPHTEDGKRLHFLRARSQIPVVSMTGRAPGWPVALKLPGTAV